MYAKDEDYTPKGGLTQDDIWQIYERVKNGDRIKYRQSEGYVSKVDENNDTKHNYCKCGTVLNKFPHYCVVLTSNGTKEGVLWLDVILNGGHDDE